jgi:hypothetical protein
VRVAFPPQGGAAADSGVVGAGGGGRLRAGVERDYILVGDGGRISGQYGGEGVEFPGAGSRNGDAEEAEEGAPPHAATSTSTSTSASGAGAGGARPSGGLSSRFKAPPPRRQAQQQQQLPPPTLRALVLSRGRHVPGLRAACLRDGAYAPGGGAGGGADALASTLKFELGDTALHLGVRNFKPRCVAALLRLGADPTARNAAGAAALQLRLWPAVVAALLWVPRLLPLRLGGHACQQVSDGCPPSPAFRLPESHTLTQTNGDSLTRAARLQTGGLYGRGRGGGGGGGGGAGGASNWSKDPASARTRRDRLCCRLHHASLRQVS